MFLSSTYTSQVGNGIYNDCGEACVVMLASGYGKRFSIEDVEGAMGRYGRTDGITDIVDGMGRLGLPARSLIYHSYLEVQQSIDSGYAIIALIPHYQMLPDKNRYDKRYSAGHYVLIVGYEGDAIIYNDPLFPDNRGYQLRIPASRFFSAWQSRIGIVPIAPRAYRPTPILNTPVDSLTLIFQKIEEDLMAALSKEDLTDAIAEAQAKAIGAQRIAGLIAEGRPTPTFYRQDASGAITINAPINTKGAVWIPSMLIFYALGGIDDQWKSY